MKSGLRRSFSSTAYALRTSIYRIENKEGVFQYAQLLSIYQESQAININQFVFDRCFNSMCLIFIEQVWSVDLRSKRSANSFSYQFHRKMVTIESHILEMMCKFLVKWISVDSCPFMEIALRISIQRTERTIAVRCTLYTHVLFCIEKKSACAKICSKRMMKYSIKTQNRAKIIESVYIEKKKECTLTELRLWYCMCDCVCVRGQWFSSFFPFKILHNPFEMIHSFIRVNTFTICCTLCSITLSKIVDSR